MTRLSKILIIEDGKTCGIVLNDGSRVLSDAVIVATGGLSYPSTGSTGDGYRFAKKGRAYGNSAAAVPCSSKIGFAVLR